MTTEFSETIHILESLQKPKKIGIMSSCGKKHNFLCKPNDDLRKDRRLMDLNTMINALLQNDKESRMRGLRIFIEKR